MPYMGATLIGPPGGGDNLRGTGWEMKISYFVTYTSATDTRRDCLRGLTLDSARRQACRLIEEGKRAVAIWDTRGHEIRGDELAACCRGEKLLTFNLQTLAKAP